MSREYLTIPEVIEMHRLLIEQFGGAHGIREPGALESAVFRPQMGYYADLIAEAAALMESLAMTHPFVDGNKRIAFFAADTFLRANGQYLDCDDENAYRDFMDIFEAQTFDVGHLTDWLRAHIKSLG